MNMDKKIKDAIALEIYRLIKSSEQSIPMDGKFLVVEFNEKDGNIDRISLESERKEGDRVLCVEIEGVNEGKELYRRIREEVENKENLEIDTDIWEMIGNAYDWPFWGEEHEEQ